MKSIMAGIMYFIIPKFKEIFADFGVTLPAITVMLTEVSAWVAGNYEPGSPGNRLLVGHAGDVVAAAWSRDGKTVVSGDADGVVVVPRAVEAQAVARAFEKVSSEDRTREELAAGARLKDVFAKYRVL